MNTIDISRVIGSSVEIFEDASDKVGGIEVATHIPDYMMKGDAKDGLAEEAKTAEGYNRVRIQYTQIPEFVCGRVLLNGDKNRGFVPVVIMPLPRSGSYRFVQFNEPYNPSEGLNEGQLLALAFETLTRENAGFGGHETSTKAFEGGHLAVSALASYSPLHAEKLNKDGHDGVHEILGGSVTTSFDRASLTDKDVPLPKCIDINTAQRNPDEEFILWWHEKMVDKSGTPIVAAHQFAGQVLLGNVINNLGDKGLGEIVTSYVDGMRS